MSELEDLIERTCSPSEMQRRIDEAKAYFARMKPEEYAKKKADERALWAVKVLDRNNPNWCMAKGPDDYYCLPGGSGTALAYDGMTLEAARIAAATALVEADPTLDTERA